MALYFLAAAAAALVAPAAATEAQLNTPRLVEPQQRAEFPLEGDDTNFKFSYVEQGAVTDNEAALQLRITKNEVPFLSTLTEPGQASFITFMKPCSILLPHIHPRATEFFQILFGQMDGGIAQENGALQNITLDINPGEVFVVPQGLLHHNHNQQCEPLVFLQTFNSADPGALNVIGALAAFNDGDEDGQAAMLASGAESIEASPQGAFALDEKCLKRCGFAGGHYDKHGRGGGSPGLEGLPKELAVLAGL